MKKFSALPSKNKVVDENLPPWTRFQVFCRFEQP